MPITQNLFHTRTLKKALTASSSLKNGEIPPKAKATLQKWHDLIESNKIQNHKESNLQSLFASELCGDILGYKPVTKKVKNNWTLVSEEKVGSGSVDICLGKFNDESRARLVMLELKGPNTTDMDRAMLGRGHSTVEQARNYAYNSNGEAQWFMVSNCIEIRLYKYPESGKLYQSWQIADLIKPEEYECFVLLLGAKNLITGKTEKLYKQSLQAEKDITNELYSDYRDIRIKMINGMKSENNRIRRADMIARAQTLLDRVLFIAFAEDRELLPQRTLQEYIFLTLDNSPLSSWDRLKILFNSIDKGNPKQDIPRYNGDLFKPNGQLEELEISDQLLQQFQRLWEYDFATEVSESILGHIFEQSIEDLDKIYETVEEDIELSVSQQTKGTTGKRKNQGVVYTPDFITSWIVEKTLGGYLQQQRKQIEKDHELGSIGFWQSYRDRLATTRICDPACGSGAFLVAAFKYLKEEFKTVNASLETLGDKGDLFSKSLNDDILNNNLFGVDINAESVEIARLSLWLATAEKGKPLVSLKDNIKQGNSIINHKKDDKNAFSWTGQFTDFDVVLGNPPYVRQERLSDIKPYLEANYKTYHGVADLYTYFFELGINILKKGGYLGYISSATFFKTGSGKSLRKHLSVQANLESIVDFGDLQVFEGVTTYPAILIMSKPSRSRQKAPDSKLKFWNVEANKLDDLKLEMLAPKWGEISQNKLADDGWRLEDERLQALRHKIVKSKPTLKEVYGSPLYGLKIGLNAAFVIDETTYNKIITANPASMGNLKPFLEGKDLKKWRAEPRNLYLILFPRGWTRKQMGKEEEEVDEEKAWQWLQQQHPQICEWLDPFAEKGRKRGDKGEFWWELRACTYYDKFSSPKINYGHFSPSSIFYFDQKSYYSNDKSYIIPKADYFLLGLLNSSIHWMLIASMCPFVRGGYYEVRTYFIDTLPIPKATNTQQEYIATLAKSCQEQAELRYQQQNGIRKNIPSLCPDKQDSKLNNKLKSWWTLSFEDFQKEIKKQYKYSMTLEQNMQWQDVFESHKQKIQQNSAELAQKEQQLNQAVYELFGLDEAEIKLLEESLH
jgi:type I restriction-modification system DNA methylase subunit